MLTIEERIGGEETKNRLLRRLINNNLRVAVPAIITKFDPVEQVVNARPTIREKVNDGNGNVIDIELPELLDLPIIIPQCGNYAITMPIKVGDECLVVFADTCIDAWWANGGIQNQIELRRHDLSDGFAIIGVKSQPNRLENYSADSLQIRNAAGTAYIELNGSNINLVGTVKINGTPIGG